MMDRHLLLLFLDGVGLGEDDPSRNPFCLAKMPALKQLLGDNWFLRERGRVSGARASMVPTDACLGVPGRPQSATGQATLLTGTNVPAMVGEHFGPKPTPEINSILTNGNLFSQVLASGGAATFLNPYPPRFFEGISSGRRLLSAVPLAAQSAGLRLMTHADLMGGRAVSPDFTGEGWRDHLDYPETPVLGLKEAGVHLARLAQEHALTFFEHWPSDLVGHRRNMGQAVKVLERLDRVVAGLLDHWDWEAGTILITSDHGNIEDLSVRTHTLNQIPTIIVGSDHHDLAAGVESLVDIAPTALRSISR